MHWSEKIAEELIEGRPQKEEYVLAAGISPSGTVHIGNFRDVATIYLVGKALERKGKKIKLLFSWDEYDRFRKVPKNIPEDRQKEYQGYLGLPYAKVPDPHGCHESYAEHFEKEFEHSLDRMGLKFDIIRYQAKEYASGAYKDKVILSLQKRKEIFDIIASFKTQDFSNEDRETYYPLAIYCESCGKDNTKVTGDSEDCHHLHYTCKCGHEGKLDLDTQTNFKLAWKIDWPMRWWHEGVDFEPGGKDHAAPQGSYQVSKRISQEIFNYQPPMFQGYEFIGIKGLTGKMSGSTGLSLNLEELLNVYAGEIIIWMYAKKLPTEHFNIGLSDDVNRVYADFDRFYGKYLENPEELDEATRTTLELSLINGKPVERVSFNILTTLHSISNGRTDLVAQMLQKIGQNVTEKDFENRIKCVDHWLRNYYPEAMIQVRTEPPHDVFSALDDDQKGWVKGVYEVLKSGKKDPETLQSELFSVAKDEALEDKVNRQNQKRFFQAMYRILIDRDRGPALATLVMALGEEKVLEIIEPLVK